MLIQSTQFKIIKGDFQKISRDPDFIATKFPSCPTELSVRKTFRNVFNTAKRGKRIKVVFFVSNLKDFPAVGVAKIVSQEILRFCRAFPGVLKEMVLAVEDKKTFILFKKQVYSYLHHVQESLGCGPYVTVDMIIAYRGGIVVIERTNPPYGLALPGGFVDRGETLESAAIREAKEETNLKLENLRQFHAYSDPRRDPRFQTISMVFTAQGKGVLRSGDDAQGARVISLNEIRDCNFAFDHKDILCDYLNFRGRKRAAK